MPLRLTSRERRTLGIIACLVILGLIGLVIL